MLYNKEYRLIESTEEIESIIVSKKAGLDVRAPIEFESGHLVGAFNSAILNNEERALIGTTYKQKGKEEAIRLGHEVVSGAVREQRIQNWIQIIKQNNIEFLYCFRGGLRSKTAQEWIAEAGIELPRIEGGYKRIRQIYLEAFKEISGGPDWWVISGPTGSGKTILLKDVLKQCPGVDLESAAKHRGSAFGALDILQPSQAQFENEIAQRLIEWRYKGHLGKFLVEDESRMIGSLCQPLEIFEKIRQSAVVWIEESVEARAQRILNEYLKEPLTQNASQKVYLKMKKAIQAISKKLGSEKATKLSLFLDECEMEYLRTGSLEKNLDWISDLLRNYYDPFYLNSLNKRQVKVVFRGNHIDCRDFILQSNH